MKKVDLWLAANPGFPKQRAADLRRVIAQMKADGSYDKIVASYVPSAGIRAGKK
jgi:ABC-type amino acid transport substrate-binding protein